MEEGEDCEVENNDVEEWAMTDIRTHAKRLVRL
jgi:hypothetical protein